MQNAVKPNEHEECGSLKHLKLKYRIRGPNNTAVLQNWFPLRNYVPPI